MTTAINNATSAKYHEAINIIDIERTTPILESILKKERTCIVIILFIMFNISFTNDKNENVVAN